MGRALARCGAPNAVISQWHRPNPSSSPILLRIYCRPLAVSALPFTARLRFPCQILFITGTDATKTKSTDIRGACGFHS